MNRSQISTALLLTLSACPALSACTRNQPGFAFDDSVQAPLAPGQGTSLIRTDSTADVGITHLAVSDDYLFFSVFWEGIVRMPKYGGKPEWVEQDTQADFEAVAADSSEVFWIRSTFAEPGDVAHTRVERRLASGGPIEIIKDGGIGVAGANGYPSAAVDATNLYSLDATLVWAFPLAGEGPLQFSFANVFPPPGDALPPGETYPPVIPNWVPDYPAMYFSNCLIAQTCALWKTDAPGGVVTSLMPLQPGPGGDSVEAVDDTFLFLIKGQHVVRMSKADLTISDLYVPEAGQTILGPLLIDDSNVYLKTLGPTLVQILKVPKAGGPAQPIAWGSQLQRGIGDLAQDPSFIFTVVGPSTDATGSAIGTEILMFPKTPVSSPDAGQPAM